MGELLGLLIGFSRIYRFALANNTIIYGSKTIRNFVIKPTTVSVILLLKLKTTVGRRGAVLLLSGGNHTTGTTGANRCRDRDIISERAATSGYDRLRAIIRFAETEDDKL